MFDLTKSFYLCYYNYTPTYMFSKIIPPYNPLNEVKIINFNPQAFLNSSFHLKNIFKHNA